MALNKRERVKFMGHPFAMAVSQALTMLRYSRVERPVGQQDLVVVHCDPNLWRFFEHTIVQAFEFDERFAECYPELVSEEKAREVLKPRG